MHDSVVTWVADQLADHALRGAEHVLEVGSLDVNGSVRGLFRGGEYTGIDMRPGPGVDIVGLASAIPFVPQTFDVVISTEMLEHDPTFWLSMAEMGRVLKTGGHLLVTTRGNGFGEHHEPSDYWRFMPSAGALLVALAGCRVIAVELDPEVPGLFLHGLK